MRQLQGSGTRVIKLLQEELEELLLYLEAELDFGEEDIEFMSEATYQKKLDQILHQVKEFLSQFQRSEHLRRGIDVVLTGSPNAGKSCLFNALVKSSRAIVTPIAGTTRDVLDSLIDIDGIPFRLHDTAGLRQSDNVIEQEGIRRSQEMLQKAHIVLWIIDVTEGMSLALENQFKQIKENLTPSQSLWMIWNKVDLLENQEPLPALQAKEIAKVFSISAQTQLGLHDLERAFVESLNQGAIQGEAEMMLNVRHQHLFRQAEAALLRSRKMPLDMNQELIAYELREALKALCEVLGETFEDDILNKIFSRFCIGK